MTARIRTPAQLELARTFADAFAAASHPGRWYSEQRGPLGWSAQLTYDPPHNTTETDGEQTVRSISGARVRLRNVRRVPAEVRGMGIDAIRAALFAEA
jgi:hypothetical protein